MIGLYFLTVPVEGLTRLNHGDVLTFVAAALYAVHIILVGDYTQRHAHGALSVLQVGACAVLAWIAAGTLAALGWQNPHFDASRGLYAGIAICAVFATAAAFSIQLWAQQYTTPSHAAIIFTLEPVFAVITSYIVIRERLSARLILGAVFVLGGILIAELLGARLRLNRRSRSSRVASISRCGGVCRGAVIFLEARRRDFAALLRLVTSPPYCTGYFAASVLSE
ncbi:MAG: DMT family transporter [Candidatus Acidiferrum sp.]